MDPITFADLVTAAVGIITDLGLMPVVLAGAVIGLGMFILRRAKAGVR